MNEAQWAACEAYIADLLPRMRLAHWSILLERESCDDDSHAIIITNDTKYEARLYLHPKFQTYTPEAQRLTFLHELIHVHNRNVTTAIDLIKPVFGSGVLFDTVVKAHNAAEESVADALSRVLAPFMPLPDIPPADAGTTEATTGAAS